MKFSVVIPARHASTRLPGKMLADIAGKPLVVHVAERAKHSGASEIIIATDHADIASAVQQHGHIAELTRVDHASGTDRIAEVSARRGWEDDAIIVNVQGDEPLVEPALIRAVAERLAAHEDAAIATACAPIANAEEFANPNIVKVVMDNAGYALYFSRAMIPYPRDTNGTLTAQMPAFRHIGIYAYRARFLKRYASLTPAPLEETEKLEQLRALWHGHKITVAITPHAPHAGVDTPEDLARVRAIIGSV